MDLDNSAEELPLQFQALIGHSARDVVHICWISLDDGIQSLQDRLCGASDYSGAGASPIGVLEPLDRFGEDLR